MSLSSTCAVLVLVTLAACDQRASFAVPDARSDQLALDARATPRGWAFSAGGPGHDEAMLAFDRARNEVVVAGRFAGIASFGAETISAGEQDGIFVARLGAADRKLRWVLPIRATLSTWFTGPRMALDGAGNAHLAIGGISGSASVGSQSVAIEGPTGLLVVTIDPAGTPIRAKPYGGAGSTVPGVFHYLHGIATDPTGAVTIAGTFSGSFDLGVEQLVSGGGSDIFVLRLAPDGRESWTRSAGGPGMDWCYAVETDAAGVSTIGGMVDKGEASFGDHRLTATKTAELFIARIDADGSWTWATSTASSGFATLQAYPNDLALDAEGNTYAAGATYNPYRPLLVRVLAAGRVDWAEPGKGSGSNEGDAAVGILVNGGVLEVAGYFSGSRQFGDDPLVSQGEDIFRARVDLASGRFLETYPEGGTGNDRAYSIARDAEGSLYLAGSFSDSVSLGGTTLTSKGDTDLFVWKIPAPEP
jgi:hypothetical protein